MDVFSQTVWWGAAYDDPRALPAYVARWKPVHEWVFGTSPVVAKDGQEEVESDLADQQRQELKQRRLRIMAEKQAQKSKRM
jgi:hypothetical protein